MRPREGDLGAARRAGRSRHWGLAAAALTAAGLATVWVGCGGGAATGQPAKLPERPSIVLIVTDDQRWDTLFAVPETYRALGQNGVEFRNAFVTNPVCCPFRSSLLSGGFYSRHTGVLTALPPNGGALRFDDRETLGTLLQAQGYRTALIGKYMNRLSSLAPHVPPGWDRFLAAVDLRDWWDTGYLTGSTGPDAPGRGERVRSGGYITDFEADSALEFLATAEPGDPFFLYLAFNAPHRPAVAPPRDSEHWEDFRYRGRSWGESDLTDKPRWVQRRAQRFRMPDEADASATIGDPLLPPRFPARQLASLRPVDRAVVRILARLEERGVAGETVVIFTSDNGMLWGEHRLMTKAMPYEEAIRVPLLVRYPGVAPRTVDEAVAVDLDVAATLLAITGLGPRGDGRSLVPLLAGDGGGRDTLFLEGYGVPGQVPAWSALRTAEWKYVEYVTGEQELYHLAVDPLEQRSVHAEPAHRERMDRFGALLEPHKGLAVITTELAEATAGRAYRAGLRAWGGREPYRWRVSTGALPPGLQLSEDGVLSGTLPRAGSWPIHVEVQDSSSSPATGRPQSVVQVLELAAAP